MTDQHAKLLRTCFEGADRCQRDRRLRGFDLVEQGGASDYVTVAGDPDRASVCRDEGVTIHDQPQPRRGMALHRHPRASLDQCLAEAAGRVLEVRPGKAGEELGRAEPVLTLNGCRTSTSLEIQRGLDCSAVAVSGVSSISFPVARLSPTG